MPVSRPGGGRAGGPGARPRGPAPPRGGAVAGGRGGDQLPRAHAGEFREVALVQGERHHVVRAGADDLA
ncbi:hypothetical protein, partial [Nocardia asiatica]|uniref:hypothetical protein n=1 Tax=Nocardia asiatica TaxID=209252 RepID=UPI0024577A38